jgi:hypothetical protein
LDKIAFDSINGFAGRMMPRYQLTYRLEDGTTFAIFIFIGAIERFPLQRVVPFPIRFSHLQSMLGFEPTQVSRRSSVSENEQNAVTRQPQYNRKELSVHCMTNCRQHSPSFRPCQG